MECSIFTYLSFHSNRVYLDRPNIPKLGNQSRNKIMWLKYKMHHLKSGLYTNRTPNWNLLQETQPCSSASFGWIHLLSGSSSGRFQHHLASLLLLLNWASPLEQGTPVVPCINTSAPGKHQRRVTQDVLGINTNKWELLQTSVTRITTKFAVISRQGTHFCL